MDDEIIFSDHRITVSKNGDLLKLFYHIPHSLTLNLKDHKEIDNEVIRILRIRSQDEKKLFVQKEAGKIIGISRQMINRRWKIYKIKGLKEILSLKESLIKEKTIKTNPEMVDRITELYSENIFYSKDYIISKLINEGYCESIAEGSIRYALRKINGNKFIRLLRKREKKSMPELFMGPEYLIEKLFQIIETLFKKVTIAVKDEIINSHSYNYLKSFYNKIKSEIKERTKDKYRRRVKLRRDKRRNIGYVERLINNVKELFKKCPDCHDNKVSFVFKRKRYYVNKEGIKKESYSEIYKCNNRECRTKYFTVPPKGVELYARVHKDIKKMVFRWFFHLRGTLSRVNDELYEHGIKVAITTILRWIKKAGEECVDMNKLSQVEDKTQSLCLDEKWIKIRSEWKYVFTAVGAETSDLIAIELYHQKDKTCIEAFLVSLKMAGFNPYSITTDMLLGYENVVKKIFPDSIYNNCALHAERDAKKLVKKHVPNKDKYSDIKELLRKRIRILFESKNLKQVKKRYYKIIKLKEKVPKRAHCLYKMLKKYFPKLCNTVTNNKLPKTTNSVERAIGEFEEKYHLMKGFTNFYFAQFFIRSFQIYYCLRKITFGRLKNKNRLELKNNPIGKLNFGDYLTPTYH